MVGEFLPSLVTVAPAKETSSMYLTNPAVIAALAALVAGVGFELKDVYWQQIDGIVTIVIAIVAIALGVAEKRPGEPSSSS
jgi:predicted membrane protein